MKSKAITFLQGCVMGVAEVIPGVSGSTLALIMNIYDEFIGFLHSISEFVKGCLKFIIRRSSITELKQDFFSIKWNFGIPLLIGMIVSFGAFASVLSFLLDEYPSYVFAFFFGLVLASIVIPYSRIKHKTRFELGIGLISFGVFLYVFGLDPLENTGDPNLLFVFFAGMIAISAMVLPGVSGSFILLLFGLYEYTIDSVKFILERDISQERLLRLVVLGIGIITGFIIFVRVVRFLLEKYESQLMAFLIGLMLASLRILWPFMDTSVQLEHIEDYTKIWPWEMEVADAFIIILIIGVAALFVLLLKNTSRKQNNKY